jgi:uncharacterized protein involved in exopolysaccharide biosynthesis
MNFDFSFYRSLFWRRLPVMALFVLVCSGLGIITALQSPETFYTDARLVVEAPRISDELVRDLNTTEAVEQLEIIEQKLMTRANLIEIANRFQVFENIRAMEPDEVEELMRENTRIRRSAGRNQATLMSLGFEARSGRIAADVVNDYVTLVLDENNRVSAANVTGTRQFFERQVERLGADLSSQSAAIASFKSENADALPEDQTFRLQRQTNLQESLSRLERELAATKSQKADFENIYRQTGQVQQETQQNMSPQEQELLATQAELDRVKSTYSERHPTVIRLTDRVARLQGIVDSLKSTQVGVDQNISRDQALFEASLAEYDNRIEFIENDLESTREEVEKLQAAIQRSSANGIELDALQREYESTQLRFNAAQANLNTALMSETVVDTGQGQRIEVIENAVVPRIPAGPNRPVIAAAGVVAGLGLAGAWFMLLEVLNRSIRRPAELVGRFNVTPITSIPYMESRGRRFARRAGLITATLAVFVAVPFALWYIDQNYLPLEIVVQKGLARLGLG